MGDILFVLASAVLFRGEKKKKKRFNCAGD